MKQSLLSQQKVVPSIKNNQISWENKYVFHWEAASWVISTNCMKQYVPETKGSLCGIAFVMMHIYLCGSQHYSKSLSSVGGVSSGIVTFAFMVQRAPQPHLH